MSRQKPAPILRTGSATSSQARGRMGGLTTAALAPSPQHITRAANDANERRYIERVRAARPEITDEAELKRRAALLRKADMIRLSQKAARARKLKAELREIEAELGDASGAAGDAA